MPRIHGDSNLPQQNASAICPLLGSSQPLTRTTVGIPLSLHKSRWVLPPPALMALRYTVHQHPPKPYTPTDLCATPSNPYSPFNFVIPFLCLARGRDPLLLLVVFTLWFPWCQTRSPFTKVRRRGTFSPCSVSGGLLVAFHCLGSNWCGSLLG